MANRPGDAEADVVDDVLTCPHCGAGRIARLARAGLAAPLGCLDCGVVVERDGRDWFYSFGRSVLTQDRSLLVHEGRPGNPGMTRFAYNLNAAPLRDAVRQCSPRVLLDVGCGNGAYHELFRGLFTRYYGLEPSPIPAERRSASEPPPEVTLVHHDPAIPLPVRVSSVDLTLFIASYDHIPNRTEVLKQAWQATKPGGFLLINMTNYNFWAKRLANTLTRGSRFKHSGEHVCVHTPRSLADELRTAVGPAALVLCQADYLYVPNTPLTVLYRSRTILEVANRLLRLLMVRILRLSNAGSSMILVFQRPIDSSSGPTSVKASYAERQSDDSE